MWYDDSDRKIHISIAASSRTTRTDIARVLADHNLSPDTVVEPATFGKRRLLALQAEIASDPAFEGVAIGISAAEDNVLVTPNTNAPDGTQARITKAATQYARAVRITTPTFPAAAQTACGPRGSSYFCDRPLHGAVGIDSVRSCSSGYLAHSNTYHYVC